MTTSLEPAHADEWTLDVVEDVEIPGWIYIPSDMTPEEREAWIAGSAHSIADIVGDKGFDGEDISFADVQPLLEAALEMRDEADSSFMFQIWPVYGPASVVCYITVLPSADLPDWTEISDVVHTVDAPHIGPGLQCSTRRNVVADDGTELELSSVHLVFDNGDATLLVSVDEAIAELVACALPGLTILKEVLAMKRDDGVPFQSVSPSGVLQGSPWRLEDEA